MKRILLVTLLMSCAPAAAHDWYPLACCRGTEVGGDCAPLPASRVKETPQGYLIDGKILKSYAETRWSPDGQFHACFPASGALSCFFAPQRSF